MDLFNEPKQVVFSKNGEKKTYPYKIKIEYRRFSSVSCIQRSGIPNADDGIFSNGLPAVEKSSRTWPREP